MCDAAKDCKYNQVLVGVFSAGVSGPHTPQSQELCAWFVELDEMAKLRSVQCVG